MITHNRRLTRDELATLNTERRNREMRRIEQTIEPGDAAIRETIAGLVAIIVIIGPLVCWPYILEKLGPFWSAFMAGVWATMLLGISILAVGVVIAGGELPDAPKQKECSR